MIRKGIIVTRDGMRILGGPGSGNFGHAGVPGQRGGSAPGGSGGGGGGSKAPSTPKSETIKTGFTDGGHYDDATPEERELADKYKRNSAYLNGALIKGSNEYEEAVKTIDSMIDRSELSQGGFTYSGVGEKFANDLDEMGIGSQFTSPAYISTSKDPEVAKEFSAQRDLYSKKPRVLLKVTNYAGQKGFYFGNNPRGGYDEKELLLPRNEKFTIGDIRTEGQYKVITVIRGDL